MRQGTKKFIALAVVGVLVLSSLLTVMSVGFYF